MGNITDFLTASSQTAVGFPDYSVGKESAYKAGDPGLIPGSGQSAGEGIAYPLQYSWASLVAQFEESACQAGDASLIPGLGRSPEGRNGNPLLYSCLGNPMDRGTWQAAVHGVTKELDMT